MVGILCRDGHYLQLSTARSMLFIWAGSRMRLADQVMLTTCAQYGVFDVLWEPEPGTPDPIPVCEHRQSLECVQCDTDRRSFMSTLVGATSDWRPWMQFALHLNPSMAADLPRSLFDQNKAWVYQSQPRLDAGMWLRPKPRKMQPWFQPRVDPCVMLLGSTTTGMSRLLDQYLWQAADGTIACIKTHPVVRFPAERYLDDTPSHRPLYEEISPSKLGMGSNAAGVYYDIADTLDRPYPPWRDPQRVARLQRLHEEAAFAAPCASK